MSKQSTMQAIRQRLADLLSAEPDERLLDILVYELEAYKLAVTDGILASRYQELEFWFGL